MALIYLGGKYIYKKVKAHKGGKGRPSPDDQTITSSSTPTSSNRIDLCDGEETSSRPHLYHPPSQAPSFGSDTVVEEIDLGQKPYVGGSIIGPYHSKLPRDMSENLTRFTSLRHSNDPKDQAEAAKLIFAANNKDAPMGYIDLHGLFLKEALERCEGSLGYLQLTGKDELRINLGRGFGSYFANNNLSLAASPDPIGLSPTSPTPSTAPSPTSSSLRAHTHDTRPSLSESSSAASGNVSITSTGSAGVQSLATELLAREVRRGVERLMSKYSISAQLQVDHTGLLIVDLEGREEDGMSRNPADVLETMQEKFGQGCVIM